MLFDRVKHSLAARNVGSSFIRGASRGIWGLALPALMSVTNFGVYSILQTTAAILAQISTLGAPQTILREPNKQLPLAGIFVHAFLILILVCAAVYFLMPGHPANFYGLIFLLSLCYTLYFIANARSKSKLRFNHVLLAELIGAIVLLAGLSFFLTIALRERSSVLGYQIVVPFEILSLLVISFLLMRKLKLQPSERAVRGTFRFLPSVYSLGFLVMFDIAIWRRIEVYFLQNSFEGLSGVAVFSLASQVGVLFMLLPNSVLESWLPRFAEIYRKNANDYEIFVNRQFKKYAVMYVCFLLAAPAAGGVLVKFLFTKYLQWLFYIVAIIFIRLASGFSGFYATILYATQKESRLYLPVIGSAVISILANSTLTLRYGLTGVLLSYFLTQLFVSAGTFLAYRRIQIVQSKA